jgi:hypothetical protein
VKRGRAERQAFGVAALLVALSIGKADSVGQLPNEELLPPMTAAGPARLREVRGRDLIREK